MPKPRRKTEIIADVLSALELGCKNPTGLAAEEAQKRAEVADPAKEVRRGGQQIQLGARKRVKRRRSCTP